MSGFPGPHSYSEFAARQLERDREEARSEAMWPPVGRTPDADDFCDALLYRAQAIEAGDRKTADYLRRAFEIIRRLEHEVCELRNQNRKEGNSEGK